MNFLKVFEETNGCAHHTGSVLSAAGRAAAFCILVVLFMLTIYTLW